MIAGRPSIFCSHFKRQLGMLIHLLWRLCEKSLRNADLFCSDIDRSGWGCSIRWLRATAGVSCGVVVVINGSCVATVGTGTYVLYSYTACRFSIDFMSLVIIDWGHLHCFVRHIRNYRVWINDHNIFLEKTRFVCIYKVLIK